MKAFRWSIVALLLPAWAAFADQPILQKAGEWEITWGPGKDGARVPPEKHCLRQKSLFDNDREVDVQNTDDRNDR
jgi:hypothetical protein